MSKRNGAVTASQNVKADENENVAALAYRAKSGGLLLQATAIISGTSSATGAEVAAARRLTTCSRPIAKEGAQVFSSSFLKTEKNKEEKMKRKK